MSNLLRLLVSSITGIVLLAGTGPLQQTLAQRAFGSRVSPPLIQKAVSESSGTILSKTAAAADTLANRGFEDDAVMLDPWVKSGLWFVQTGTASPDHAIVVPAPTEGTQAAMSDQDGPTTNILYQDVALLASPADIELKFDLYADNIDGTWIVPSTGTIEWSDTTNQHFRVDIMDPDSAIDNVDGGVLMNIFRPEEGVDPATFGYTEMTADLSAFAGDTVRLRFAVVVTEDVLLLGVDDVRLTQTPIIPGVPTLLTPLNGATNLLLEPVALRWSPVTYATRYNVQVATDMAFHDIVWSTNVPNTQASFTPASFGTTYYWRAQSSGVHGMSAFSAPFHFTTVPIPNTPTLLTPLNGAVDVPNVVPLRFTNEPFAVRYNVQVATDMAFHDIIWSTNVPHSPVTFAAPTPGTKYFWRAQSVGEFGNSKFTAPFSFTTENLLPTIPTLVAPPYGAEDLETTVNLQWNAAMYAERYEVQVANDSMFSEIVFHENTPGLDADFVAPEAGQTYFWRVQAFGPGGASPGYSVVWKFSVGTEGSLLPATLFPEDGATDVPVDVTLLWEPPASNGAGTASKASALTFYHVQVARNASYDDPVVDEDSVMVDSLRVTGLRNNTLYYWRVAGVDEKGRFTFTMSSSFTTIVALPRRVSLITPSDGAAGVSALASFFWQTAGGADTYQLQVATDAAFTSLVLDEDGLTGTSFQTVVPLGYNTVHYWRVRAKNIAGAGEWAIVRSFTTVVGTAVEQDEVPTSYALHDNYPNPFNPSTTIVVDLPEATTIRLAVYDVAGHQVMRLESGKLQAGRHRYTVDASRLSSGVYLYRIESPAFNETKRMTVLK